VGQQQLIDIFEGMPPRCPASQPLLGVMTDAEYTNDAVRRIATFALAALQHSAAALPVPDLAFRVSLMSGGNTQLFVAMVCADDDDPLKQWQGVRMLARVPYRWSTYWEQMRQSFGQGDENGRASAPAIARRCQALLLEDDRTVREHSVKDRMLVLKVWTFVDPELRERSFALGLDELTDALVAPTVAAACQSAKVAEVRLGAQLLNLMPTAVMGRFIMQHDGCDAVARSCAVLAGRPTPSPPPVVRDFADGIRMHDDPADDADDPGHPSDVGTDTESSDTESFHYLTSQFSRHQN
jgi:hypothetical protein